MMKILIIQDEPEMRRNTAALLRYRSSSRRSEVLFTASTSENGSRFEHGDAPNAQQAGNDDDHEHADGGEDNVLPHENDAPRRKLVERDVEEGRGYSRAD